MPQIRLHRKAHGLAFTNNGWDYFIEILDILDVVKEKHEYESVMKHVKSSNHEDFVSVYCPDLVKLRNIMYNLEATIARPCCIGLPIGEDAYKDEYIYWQMKNSRMKN